MVGLYCFTSPSGSFNWYHTLDPVQAGISGDLIVSDAVAYLFFGQGLPCHIIVPANNNR